MQQSHRPLPPGGEAVYCRISPPLPPGRGQWAVELPQYTASLPGAVGNATPAMHCFSAWGQWAVQLLK